MSQVGPGPRCSACQRAIWYGITAKGKRMPIDPVAVEDGNVVVDDNELALRIIAAARLAGEPSRPPADGAPVRVLRKTDPDPGDVARYVSHFATCPDAGRFRR